MCGWVGGWVFKKKRVGGFGPREKMSPGGGSLSGSMAGAVVLEEAVIPVEATRSPLFFYFNLFVHLICFLF